MKKERRDSFPITQLIPTCITPPSRQHTFSAKKDLLGPWSLSWGKVTAWEWTYSFSSYKTHVSLAPSTIFSCATQLGQEGVGERQPGLSEGIWGKRILLTTRQTPLGGLSMMSVGIPNLCTSSIQTKTPPTLGVLTHTKKKEGRKEVSYFFGGSTFSWDTKRFKPQEKIYLFIFHIVFPMLSSEPRVSTTNTFYK